MSFPSLRDVYIEKARRDFWEYNKAVYPKEFNEGRPHAKLMAETLQAFVEGRLLREDGQPFKKLMLNLPPRHLKSFTLVKLCSWYLGNNPYSNIITASYNEKLSGQFSKYVRNDIKTENIDPRQIAYQDIFTARVKHGDASSQLWSLEDSHFSYMGGSPKGTLTGFGCKIGIIDDLIKDAYEAMNERILDEHWDWYTNTYLSRLEEGALQIVNFTRWSKNDLCGRLLDTQPGQWYVLKLPVFDGENMLCDELMSKESYLEKKRLTDPRIFMPNYHQEPIDDVGRLYKRFMEWDELPEGEKLCYVDTADEGKDYLCAIFFVMYKKQIYIYDVVHTQDGQEITEPLLARKLDENGTNKCMIESNNGGRAFARNVKRILKEDYRKNKTVIKWFHQSKNKKARIISNSHWVMENVYYPENWHIQFESFFKALSSYQKEGKNEHDDAPDALTGCAEWGSREKRKLKVY